MTAASRFGVITVAALCTGCNGADDIGTTRPPPPPPPAPAPSLTMTAVAGDGQTIGWGQLIPVPPAVIIVDSSGHPVSGITVTFAGGGAANGLVTGGSQITGASGIATVGSWEMTLPVGQKTLTVTAPNTTSIQFVATAVEMAQMSKFSGFDQSRPAGTAVLDPPAITVVTNGSAGSRILVGAVVQFTVTAGGGTIAGGTTTTDNYGYARVGSWTLGTAPGTNTVRATVNYPGASPMTFTATGTP